MVADELLTSLFDGQSHPLAAPMAAWLAASRRFTAFVTTHHSKIRKKLRTAQDPDSLLDLRLELETAYRLVQERSLSLVYEPPQPDHTRRPDFAVTFTTRLTFIVEVTRLQANPKSAPTEAQEPPRAISMPNPTLLAERLTEAVCSKLHQLLPQHPNVLLVGVEALPLTQSDLRAAMLRLQQRAERNEAALFQRHRFGDRADFFRHYQRLSELMVRGSQGQGAESLIVWLNPQAKHPLPSQVRTVLHHSQAV